MNKNPRVAIIAIVFILVGLVATFVGTGIAIDRMDLSDKIETTAVITDIITYRKDGDKHYKTVIEYEAYGFPYEKTLEGYNFTHRVGKELHIYFRANAPHVIMTKSARFISLLFPLFGLLFTAMGIGMLTTATGWKWRKASLKESGTLIHAPYVNTELNTRYSVNGIHPYRIVCRWMDPEDGTERMFYSENLWEDPSYIIENRNITTFTVYLEPKKKKRYLMDIDRVLETAEASF